MSSENITKDVQTDELDTTVKGGNALSKTVSDEVNNKDKDKDDDEKVGTFSKFTNYVGGALSNMAKVIPDTIDKINQDPKAKKNFLRGLNIIAESSGYDKEFKSPIGKVATGLIKAERQFTAEDIARLKATRQPRRYASPKEKGLTDIFAKYMEDYKKSEKGYRAADTRFSELYKLAQKGFEAPTGLVENFLTPFQKVISELGLGEKYDKLVTDYKGKNFNELSETDKIAFKDLFSSATKQAIVTQVKDLYPASDKDIAILERAAGDITTNPKALAQLVAAEKAAKQIDTEANSLAQDIAFNEENLNFEREAKNRAATQLANKFNKDVTDEMLIEIYGNAERSPFRVINAYYYKELQPKYKKGLDPFESYQKGQIDKNEKIKRIVDENQKKILIEK